MAGIYIHVPFCIQACHYCDFHFSISLKNKSKVIKAIIQELKSRKQYLNNHPISTIYFGGGTPSLLTFTEIKKILNVINNNFCLLEDAECTIEANPEDITKKILNSWLDAGINRISLGVQSFRDDDLNYMNRLHDGDTAKKAIELIKHSKIDNINVDLIYGFPSLTNEYWKDNIKTLIDFNIQHISCYCLTIEKNTALFHFIKTKKHPPLKQEIGRDQFIIAHNILNKNGYEHYEISNFAKKSFKSRHNRNYWNNSLYLGVGPSAHSFNGVSRQWNIKNNNLYCSAIKKNEAYYKTEILSKKDIINEYILTSIRTSQGIDLNKLFCKISSEDAMKLESEIHKLIKKKLLIKNKNKIKLSLSGMLFADRITSDLFVI